MNPFVRVLAIMLILVAASLGVIAYQLARQPPPAQEPEVAQHLAAPAPEAEPAKTVPLVVAARSMKAGETLTTSALKVAHWIEAPVDSYSDMSGLLDKTLRFDVREGQPLVPFLLARGLSNYLAADQRAVDISVQAAAGWTAIHPGDLVDIFLMLNQGAEVGATQSRLLLSKVRILAYGTRTMDRPALLEDEGKSEKGPTQAVVAVPVEHVNALLLASAKGRLHFVLRSAGDPGEPDPSLFPERESMLAGRSDLDAAAHLRLRDPANLAYAGESLGGVAGTKAGLDRAAVITNPSASAAQSKSSVQVIRGNQYTQQAY